MQKDKYRVNRQINAQEVRLIDDEGKMIGVYLSRDAIRIAEERGLDLIEIAPNAKPPTCKIMDYGKWKYENKKKAVTARKKQTVVNIKEIQVRPMTEQNDIDTKLRHARRFLLSGDKVKVNLRFSGREMAYQEVGLKVLKSIIEQLQSIANVEVPPKMEGRQMFVLLVPDPVKVKEFQKTHKEEIKDDDSEDVPIDEDAPTDEE